MTANRILLVTFLTSALVCAAGATWYFRQGEPTLHLPGIVEIQEVRLSSKIGGRIKQVQEGQIVSPGQPLVVFDVPEWEAKRAQLQAQQQIAQAQLDKARNGALPEQKAAAEAALATAKAKLLRLNNGSRPEEIEAAHRELASLKTQETKADKDFQRAQQLRTQKALSQADYDDAFTNLERLQSQARAAHERWKLANKGPREEEISEAQAEVARMQAQLDLLVRGTRHEEIAEVEARVKEFDAKLQEIDVQLREAIVLAPDKALIEVIAVRRGDTVAANHPVVRVLLAEDLWVKAYVSEPDLGKVRLNQEVLVSNDSFPGKKFQGIVTTIASATRRTSAISGVMRS